MLGTSRYLVILGVLGTFVASATMFAYGVVYTIKLVLDVATLTYGAEKGAKQLSVAMIEVIDLFLLATAVYLVSQGLYELFINPDLAVPAWMKTASLDHLKARVLGVIIVLLAVTFLGSAVTWAGGWDIAAYGFAIAVVIVSLVLTLRLIHAERHPNDSDGGD
jgi:uncharacterized membrane protein YqhA